MTIEIDEKALADTLDAMKRFRSFSPLMLLSGVTPADVLSLDAEEEYLISSELSEQIVSIAHIPLCADDHIACAEEKFSSV